VLGPGSYVGEVPLLGRGVHPATVRALTPVTGFGIDAQHFVPLVADIRRLRERVNASLARQASVVELAREDRRRQLGGTRPMQTWRLEPAARPRHSLPRKRIAVAAAVVAVAFFAASLYHPPIGIVAPTPAIDVSADVTITGVAAHAPRGVYLMLTVRTERPTLLGIGAALLHGNRHLVKPPSHQPRDTAMANRVSSEFAQRRLHAAVAMRERRG